jgi:hypothetical protein
MYEGVSKSFRTGGMERELQMEQLSATRFNCIAILWVSLVSFATTPLGAIAWVSVVSFVTIILWRGQQRVISKLREYFVIDSVRKLLDASSYTVHVWMNMRTSERNSLSVCQADKCFRYFIKYKLLYKTPFKSDSRLVTVKCQKAPELCYPANIHYSICWPEGTLQSRHRIPHVSNSRPHWSYS